MKKILITLAVVSFLAQAVPFAHAGTSAVKTYKLSVTIPESIHQQPSVAPQTLLPAPVTGAVGSQIAASQAASQGFQLVEAVRDNQKIILLTYVVE